MNSFQAKEVVGLMARQFCVSRPEIICSVIDFLSADSGNHAVYFDGFEFSLVENEEKIRLLHLHFLEAGLPLRMVKNTIESRQARVNALCVKLRRIFGGNYDISLLRLLFEFNMAQGPWPVQVGLEFQGRTRPKLKVYLSLDGRNPDIKKEFSLEKFCGMFGLDPARLKKIFDNSSFDALAVDLLPDGRRFFKFYPYIEEKNGCISGYLYRFYASSRLHSTKLWYNFPQGFISNDLLREVTFRNRFIGYLKDSQFRVHYLTEENNIKGLYFR